MADAPLQSTQANVGNPIPINHLPSPGEGSSLLPSGQAPLQSAPNGRGIPPPTTANSSAPVNPNTDAPLQVAPNGTGIPQPNDGGQGANVSVNPPPRIV
jgi:hypothetical protein